MTGSPSRRPRPAALQAAFALAWFASAQPLFAEEPRTAGGPAPDAFRWSVGVVQAVEDDAASGGALPRGSYAGLQFGALAVRTRERFRFELAGESRFRGNETSSGAAVDGQALSGSLQASLSRRTAVSASGRLAYSPDQWWAGRFAAAVNSSSAVRPLPGTGGFATRSGGASASISTELSRNVAATIDAGVDRVTFGTHTTAVTRRLAAAITDNWSRTLSLRIGYESVWSATDAAGLFANWLTHTFQGNVSWAPLVSARTRVAVGLTPAFVASGRSILPAPGHRVVFGGFTEISRAFSREWTGRARYERALYYLPGYGSPAAGHAASAAIEGRLARRVDASVAASWSDGNQTGADVETGLSSATLTGRFVFRRSASASLFAEGGYETYAAAGTLASVAGLDSRARHRVVRAGVTFNMGTR